MSSMNGETWSMDDIQGWNCHPSDSIQVLGKFWLKLVIYVSKMWRMTIPYMDEQISSMDESVIHWSHPLMENPHPRMYVQEYHLWMDTLIHELHSWMKMTDGRHTGIYFLTKCMSWAIIPFSSCGVDKKNKDIFIMYFNLNFDDINKGYVWWGIT